MQAEQIQERIKQAICSDSRWIVMHSSLMHLGLDKTSLPAFKWEFLKALRLLTAQDYKFAFPAFTFSFTKTGEYHGKLPSEVGVLADWVRDLLGAKRTHHPIYSHVLLGDDIDMALECSTQTCFGEGSIYQFFEQHNATIIMLGCDWSYCTPFHYYEQQFSVPYRYDKQFNASGDSTLFTQMFVRDEKLSVKNDFTQCLTSLKNDKKITSLPFAQGQIQSISFDDFAQQCKQDLTANILAFVRDQAVLAQQIANISNAGQQAELKVCVLAESNYEPLIASLEQAHIEVLPQYRIDLSINEYGQMANDILSGKVAEQSIDFCLLPSRLEDLLHLSDVQFSEDLSYSGIQVLVESYISLIKQLSTQVNRLVLVNLFSFGSCLLKQSALNDVADHITEIVPKLNQLMKESLKDCANVRLLPIESLALVQYQEARLWYLGKIPHSAAGFDVLANHYLGLLANECGVSTRLIVLDLDNTLWGGVLGEDGIDGVQLGGDFPGNAFKDFQRTILALHDRGIALAIASKNDETLALKAIQEHPQMLIKEEHLATYRIDWNEKSVNIQSMAQEIGLSLSNIMFVDDNPLECEKVRKLCPQVKVIELPQDPVNYMKTLLASPFLKVATTTPEDSKRAMNYAKQRQNRAQIKQFQNLDDYFASLNIKVTIAPVNDGSFNRAVQLTNKTNQFNTTTKRFSDKQLKGLLNDDDYQVVTVSYQDNATEQEVIGLLVVNYNKKNTQSCVVDLLLLSCRVLGRSIETAMLVWLEQQCLSKGITSIYGNIHITERNTPVRDIFSRHGFYAQAENEWQLDLHNKNKMQIKLPQWLQLNA